MKKREMKNVRDTDDAKKSRSANWNQIDTDLLCNLVREIGVKSVLNCRTNGTTNEIKRADWISISEHFNSHPSVATQRNVDAIIARYKKLMQDMRNKFALERSNATQTGGGSSSVPKMEITGAMLELRSYYGHLPSGLPAYDCDSLPITNSLNSNTPSVLEATIVSPIECLDSQELTQVSKPVDFTLGDPIPEKELSCRSEVIASGESSSVLTSSPVSLLKPIRSTLPDPNAVVTQQPRQYFATSAQRRVGELFRRQSRRRVVPTAVVEEKRGQLIDEERKRMAAFGDLRMQLYQKEYAARSDEIEQRKALSLILHQKQMEFWSIAIQKIQCSENPGILSAQSLPIGTVISVSNPGLQKLASQDCNVVAVAKMAKTDDDGNTGNEDEDTKNT